VPRYDRVGEQLEDDAGQPLINGKLKFEISGGGGDLDTFADINLTILNSNPVILSASGRVPNIFFNGSARVILTDKDDVQIEQKDPIPGVGVAGDSFEDWNALVQYDLNDIVKASNERFYKSIGNGNIGNDPVTTSGFWMETRLVDVFDLAYTYQTGQLAIGSDGVIYQSAGDGNIGNDPVGDQTNWTSTSSKVTVTDESADTTCFPLFVTAATGDLPPKSGTNLTFNSNTGLLTATLLGGTINTATQNTVTTMTGLTATGALNSGSITSGFGNINIGANIFTTTGGIIFNDEVLREYDEFTFVPVFADASSGGNVSSTILTGRGVRVGKSVDITIEAVDLDTTGMTPGNLAFFRNLPFMSESDDGHEFIGSMGSNTLTFTDKPHPRMVSGVSFIDFQESISAAPDTRLTISDFANGVTDIRLSLTYEIN